MPSLNLTVLLLFLSSLICFLDAWPQPTESVTWELHRRLVEYKIYASVNLGRVDLPPHTLGVNISLAIERNDGSCPVKDINIYASMFGIPVVSRDGEVFPNHTFTNASRTSSVVVPSNNETITWELEDLPPGHLILMAVMPRPDSRIKQKGLGRSCYYYLTTRAQVFHLKEENISTLHMDAPSSVVVRNGTQSILSFQVPLESLQYEVEITGCGKGSQPCSVDISVWESLGTALHWPGLGQCMWVNGSCSLQVTSPRVNFLNYLVISSNEETDVTLEVVIRSSKCVPGPRPNMAGEVTVTGNAPCSFAGQLGRETPTNAPEGSSFFDHFVAWDGQLSPHTVINDAAVPDVGFLARRFSLRPTDTGSTLRLDLRLPLTGDGDEKQTNSSSAKVDLCLSLHRLTPPGACDTGRLLQVTAREGQVDKQHVIVPYPPSGVWYVTMQSSCFQRENKTSEEVPVPCPKPVATNLTVHLSLCVDGGCGQYGSCNLYTGGGLLYSACDCFSGWRGYGCNDGSESESASTEKLAVYLLTLSNLAFLPGICLALYRRFYVEALIYAYNMFFSTFYHACDTSRIYQLCILTYNTLSFADFFASLMSFWVTLMAMSRLPAYVRSLLHVVGAVFIALGEVHNRHGLLEQMLPLVLGIGVMLLSWGFETYRQKQLFPSRPRLLKFILPGVSLAVLGLVLNLALETEQNYKYVHSSWHVLEAASICFLLPPRTSSLGRRKSGLSIQSGDITQRPLVAATTAEDDPALSHVSFQRADQMDGEGSSGGGSQPSSPPDAPASGPNGFRLHSRRNRRQNARNLIL